MSTAQRYGDLELRFTTDLFNMWGNPDNGLPQNAWTVNKAKDGALSSGHKIGPIKHSGQAGILQLRDLSADKTLLRPPVRWERIAELPSGDPYRWAVWRPIAPNGYAALGDTVFRFDVSPEQYPDYSRETACVKKTHNGRSYVREGEFGHTLVEHGSLRLVSVVVPPYPDGDLEEHLYLNCGNFTAVTAPGIPAPTPTTWVLDLPAVIEKRDGPEIPVMTSHDRPPVQTAVTDRTVTVPYFLVDDQGRPEPWKVENSPFYKIRRKRHYELIIHRDNRNGSEPQPELESVTSGVSAESSEEFSQSTGITVAMEVGVEAGSKPFGTGAPTAARTSVSATVELGYDRRTGVAAMREETKTRGLTVPPHSSACLWMEHHEIVPVRANGETLGPRATLGFNTDHYVTGQYPSDAGATYLEEAIDGARTTKAAHNLPPGTPKAQPTAVNTE
ncbi:hypothetical protein [Kitasatospora sp. NPDC093102]|uniref:hypothetical protein n=1 Tax=Kitasatospora sp. NPDC093102 TaxID=3155069 RepID=UPI0034422AE3